MVPHPLATAVIGGKYVMQESNKDLSLDTFQLKLGEILSLSLCNDVNSECLRLCAPLLIRVNEADI